MKVALHPVYNHHRWVKSLIVVAVLVQAIHTCSASGADDDDVCMRYNGTGVDYADPSIAVIARPNIPNTDCCAECMAWNELNATQPGVPQCKIVVWHNWGEQANCALKATADQPVPGHRVEAFQPPPPQPSFRFANIYTSHMVLQRDPYQAQVWGFCPAEETAVHVTLQRDDGKETTVVASVSKDDSGCKWTAALPVTASGTTPYTVKAASNSTQEVITITDVLFGDVWVCSGQSNMAYALNGSNGLSIVHPPVNNSDVEIADMENYPLLRLFRVGRSSVAQPLADVVLAADGGSDALVTGWSRPCPINGTQGTSRCRVDFSNMCYFFGRDIQVYWKTLGVDLPIGLIGSYVGGTADELWSPPDALKECLDPTKHIPSADSGLWNGMIAPLTNTTIKGAIWYQGEADSHHPGGEYDGYNCTFPAMIRSWRQHWSTNSYTNSTFPFGYVQLNSVGNGTVYNNPVDPADNTDGLSSAFGFAGLRWSQSATYGYNPNPGMPNTFAAISLDTPDRPFPFKGKNGNFDPGFNVHSPYKQPTAARLARAAWAQVYDKPTTVTPLPGNLEVEGTTLLLSIDIGSNSLLPARAQRGFEVLVNGTWMNVDFKIRSGTSIVEIASIAGATKLRYIWYSNPCGYDCFQCPIYMTVKPLSTVSGEEPFLPLPPFVKDIPQSL